MATKETKGKVGPNEGSESAISLRGKSFVGTVVSSKAHKTVSVQWERKRLVPKYQRYERRRSKVAAHNPDDMDAKEGDLVRIQECRPLSKTKHFVVTEIIERAS